MDLDEFKKNLMVKLYGITKEEAHREGICVRCRKIAAPFISTDAGEREYKQSGLCEVCFNEITNVD